MSLNGPNQTAVPLYVRDKNGARHAVFQAFLLTGQSTGVGWADRVLLSDALPALLEPSAIPVIADAAADHAKLMPHELARRHLGRVTRIAHAGNRAVVEFALPLTKPLGRKLAALIINGTFRQVSICLTPPTDGSDPSDPRNWRFDHVAAVPAGAVPGTFIVDGGSLDQYFGDGHEPSAAEWAALVGDAYAQRLYESNRPIATETLATRAAYSFLPAAPAPQAIRASALTLAMSTEPQNAPAAQEVAPAAQQQQQQQPDGDVTMQTQADAQPQAPTYSADDIALLRAAFEATNGRKPSATIDADAAANTRAHVQSIIDGKTPAGAHSAKTLAGTLNMYYPSSQMTPEQVKTSMEAMFAQYHTMLEKQQAIEAEKNRLMDELNSTRNAQVEREANELIREGAIDAAGVHALFKMPHGQALEQIAASRERFAKTRAATSASEPAARPLPGANRSCAPTPLDAAPADEPRAIAASSNTLGGSDGALSFATMPRPTDDQLYDAWTRQRR